MRLELSRRGFLKAALATALSAGFLGVPTGVNTAQGFDTGPDPQLLMAEKGVDVLGHAHAATFAPLRDSVFHLQTATGAVPFTLTAVTPLQSYPTHTSFSLIFRAPTDSSLVGATYCVAHPTLGAFDLFLSPIGPSAGVYEACFTRLSRAAT